MKGWMAACAALAALLVSSCGKLPAGGVDGPSVSRVSFVVDHARTRAAVTEHEADVASLDVLAFRSDDGGIEDHNRVVSASGVTRVTADLTDGVPVRWYVVANAPEGALSAFADEASFLAGVTLLTDGTDASLVMLGRGSLPAGPVADDVRVSLDRYACKVSVGTVTMAWEDAFALGTVALGRVVLVNVVGSTPWGGGPAVGDLWYNRMGVDTDLPPFVADLTLWDCGGAEVTASAPAAVGCSLYCMPNPLSNNDTSANAPEWTPRPTRVAVEVLIGGTPNWYPVTLPSMSCNTHYVINSLTLTGPGSPGPDWPVTRDDIRFSVSVEPWTDNDLVPVFSD